MHFKNGRAAKVGDRVVGRCYNTEGLVSGTLLSVTPGQDSCSALVGFLSLTLADSQQPYNGQVVKYQGTESHGGAGPKAITYYHQDYTHCANLLHVDDLFAAGDLLTELQHQK